MGKSLGPVGRVMGTVEVQPLKHYTTLNNDKNVKLSLMI